MRIGVQGCCHGILDNLYSLASKHNVELLIIGGDFQALRNLSDFHGISVPQKFKRLGDFHKYYSQEKVAPILTIFVGGNHEASNYLEELPYGGWIAPNIYYMGRSSVICIGNLRIAGISGIYSEFDYRKGRYERLPYEYKMLKSVYHTREFDVLSLKSLRLPIDIFLSHDWPRGIEQHGDTAKLLKNKPFFRKEVEKNDLGSPALEEIINSVKPRYWFAAHLHTRFAATVHHNKINPSDYRNVFEQGGSQSSDEQQENSKKARTEVDTVPNPKPSLENGDHNDDASQTPSTLTTHFLALDKCLPRRSYFEVIEVEPSKPFQDGDLYMKYDPEWLSIIRAMQPFQSNSVEQTPLPSLDELQKLIDKERQWVEENIVQKHKLGILRNFTPTAPFHSREITDKMIPVTSVNPQTTSFLQLIGLQPEGNEPSLSSSVKNEDEIEL
ncbi:RNA lariat debranching enzyme Dbr1 [Schizosaccharomyces cryophilus OY26]|uniref:RNA lariat debranching enzyme Dbr1 n=1 Tax=Schizosaccharomyces cryophilus (strain OY26 / ATCC MYA-4695 / CBS 11777 / NBRC 106824 / NRRL Y48691) TaxID=653667 RepID=S9XIG1_SCHCR|nr:RNA lariat debranching enzyme Dbr1 [Schizosaccharomyces cryophilus OY26]EPY53446.1 RNA lariat debranching enzyme Dbr1 [Schizosaccharomyces cryophilus OY26]